MICRPMSRCGSGMTRTTMEAPFSLHMSIAFSMNGAQPTSIDCKSLKIGQETKSALQFCEVITDLLQAFLGFFCSNNSVVADCQQLFRFVDFEVNHYFRRLYFFNNSRNRSCGSASTR